MLKLELHGLILFYFIRLAQLTPQIPCWISSIIAYILCTYFTMKFAEDENKKNYRRYVSNVWLPCRLTITAYMTIAQSQKYSSIHESKNGCDHHAITKKNCVQSKIDKKKEGGTFFCIANQNCADCMLRCNMMKATW